MTTESDPAKGPIWLALRVLDEPTTVFRELAARPRPLVPIVLLVAVAIFTAFATPAETLREQTRVQIEQFRQGGQLTEEQFNERIEGAASPRGRAMILGFGSVIGLVSLVIVSLVLMFIFGTTSGTTVSFKEELAIVAHAWVPVYLGSILVVLLAIFAGLHQLQLSLGFLFDSESNPFLFRFASQITLFGAWSMFLVALGNQIKTNWKGIAGPLMIVGGLWLLVKLGFAALGGLAGG